MKKILGVAAFSVALLFASGAQTAKVPEVMENRSGFGEGGGGGPFVVDVPTENVVEEFLPEEISGTLKVRKNKETKKPEYFVKFSGKTYIVSFLDESRNQGDELKKFKGKKVRIDGTYLKQGNKDFILISEIEIGVKK